MVNISTGGNANLFRIPRALVASSLKKLERLMLLNNLKNQVEFRYFDIGEAKGKWVAWYYLEVNKNTVIKEGLDGTSEQ